MVFVRNVNNNVVSGGHARLLECVFPQKWRKVHASHHFYPAEDSSLCLLSSPLASFCLLSPRFILFYACVCVSGCVWDALRDLGSPKLDLTGGSEGLLRMLGTGLWSLVRTAHVLNPWALSFSFLFESLFIAHTGLKLTLYRVQTDFKLILSLAKAFCLLGLLVCVTVAVSVWLLFSCMTTFRSAF